MQPRAGRLDLLLQDAEEDKRYEVEVQLGRTDESHIIRTIEYWDIERKRYPQYEHCAVIVAEDITSRFLNVIGLFNSAIPVIAIQMTALAVADGVALLFNVVLNEMSRGTEEEDEHEDQPADRAYWENRAGKESLAMIDQLLGVFKEWDRSLELKYKQWHIAPAKDGRSESFVRFRPRPDFLRIEVKTPQSAETDSKLEESGLDLIPYKWVKYRIRVTKAELA
jgi:hypothetical protein